MTRVRYFPVTNNTIINDYLDLSPNDISSFLFHDWLPSLGVVPTSLFGWPSHILDNYVDINSKILLSLSPTCSRADKQWKGFISWMLGVAGTRAVLKREGYKWIAPVSAFTPNQNYKLDLSDWDEVNFPPSILEIDRPVIKGKQTGLLPDLIAVKTNSGSVSFTLIESKGTNKLLDNKTTCPPAWKAQVDNAEIKLRRITQPVARRLVVATRVCPNALQDKTRALTIRAWNNMDNQNSSIESALEVVTAYLIKLCNKLQVFDLAKCIYISSLKRNLDSLRIEDPDQVDYIHSLALFPIDSDFTDTGNVSYFIERSFKETPTKGFRFVKGVFIHEATVNLIRVFATKTNIDFLNNVLIKTDRALDEWYEQSSKVGCDPTGLMVIDVNNI